MRCLLVYILLLLPLPAYAQTMTATDAGGTTMRLFDTPCDNEAVLAWMPDEIKKKFALSNGAVQLHGKGPWLPGCWAIGLSLNVVMGLEDETVFSYPSFLAFQPEEGL